MSERHTTPQPAALALARWTVLLMGWVWLGAQGQRLGWSLASGVLPVALWWGLRLVLAALPIPQGLPRQTPWVLGVLTALGTLLVAQVPGPGHAALLALAAVWAAWLAWLDVPEAAARCSRRQAGWPPVVAAGLTGLVTAAPLPMAVSAAAVVLLLLAAAWLGRRVPAPIERSGSSHPAALIPATAMGLMMGTLWLGSAWCSAAGWSDAAVVTLHLGLMAALPALTRLDLIPRRLPPTVAHRLPLALVCAGGSVLLAGTQAAHGLVGMVLLALAWSVHAGRHGAATPSPSRWRGAALGGPALLLAVGWLAPTQGPQALQAAYGLLGALALLTLLTAGWRTPTHHSTSLEWRDAS